MNLSFEEIVSSNLCKLKNKNILVAFSGGKDSLALLDFLNCQKDYITFNLYACHVNHGLRDDAHIDEDFCRRFCNNLGIPFKSVNIGNILNGNITAGIEDAARRHRYNALINVSRDFNCHYILTAHTFDDQIESFFTDLYTGASIFTLGGIAYENNKILRIMLDAKTYHIEDYLKRRNLLPIFDKSNNDTRFFRNRVRHNILPNLYKAGTDFVPTVLRLQKDSARINEYFYNTTCKAIISDKPHIVEIDKDIFTAFAHIEQEYLLGRIFTGRFRFTRSAITEALKLCQRKGSKRINLANEYCFEVSYSKIRLFKKFFLNAFFVEKEAGIDTINACGFKIKFCDKLAAMKLTVRNRQAGDRISDGKKLKDVFIDKKLDLFERDTAIVVAVGSDILWSEHLEINNEYLVFERVVYEG